jgi:hypothetical protein
VPVDPVDPVVPVEPVDPVVPVVVRKYSIVTETFRDWLQFAV